MKFFIDTANLKEIKEAQDLVYILSTSPGNIYLTLRNPTDGTLKARLPSSTADSILARATEGNAAAAPVVPQASPFSGGGLLPGGNRPSGSGGGR